MTNNKSSKTSWLFICIVTMMGILTLLPSDIYIPALPMMKEDFATSIENIQLTLSFFFLGAGISQLLAGPIIDCFNNKTTVLIALFTFLFASSIEALIACRFVQAFSAAFVVVASRAA